MSQLAKLSEKKYDLIVIGGGIVGAGIARDAALRGLSVILFEQGDFACGTSSRTSRMIHGGIRYLEQGDFRLVFEASRERMILHRLAPHLVRPLPFLFPFYEETGRSPWTIRAGLFLYDLIALYRNFHPHRMLSTEEITRLEPGLSSDGLRGGALFYDAQMDDARLCLEVILSARAAGATVLNYTPVEGLLRKGTGITGVSVRSILTGDRHEVFGKQVINATGPWLDRVAAFEDPTAKPMLRTTRGSHLLVPRITQRHAVVVASRRDDRVFFVLPWKADTLIGTTDQDYKEDPGQVRSTPEEVHYLLGETRRIFPKASLTEEDVIARFSGVRPLVYSPGVSASEVSRDTDIREGQGGMISVIGGKYTLHRVTAKRVVDRVVRKFGIRASSSVTHRIPLWSGRIPSFEEYIKREAYRAAREYDVPEGEVKRLIKSYGTRYTVLLERIRKNRSLLLPIISGMSETRVQIDYAVEEEMASRLSDFLRRRTDLALSRHRRSPEMIHVVAERMAELLGWDTARQEEEIHLYLHEIE